MSIWFNFNICTELCELPLKLFKRLSFPSVLNDIFFTDILLAEGDPYFTGKLQDYTAVEKDEVILQCEISKADAPVKWFKDGEEIKPSKNVVIKADGKKRMLILKKALKSDIGQYTCDCGTDKTSGKLDIEGKEISMSLLLKLLGLFLPEANDTC